MVKVIKEKIVHYWLRRYKICIFIFGAFIALVGFVGFFHKPNNGNGCFEFMAYGPMIMIVSFSVPPEERLPA